MVEDRHKSAPETRSHTAEVSSPVSASPRPRVPASIFLFIVSTCLLLTTACRQDMQDQPRMKPFRESTFFADRISSRQPVPGTVPRGFLREDKEFFTGKKSTQATTQTGPRTTTQGANLQGAAAYPDDIEYFPIAIDAKVIERGKERYEIFCSVCHGLTGNGDGMIVRRGFKRAASFHDDRLRQAPVGHFFDAITNGWGVMPSYAPQIAVQDRWAVIAYIRALQLSQQDQSGATQNASPSPQSSPAQNAPSPSTGGHQ